MLCYAGNIYRLTTVNWKSKIGAKEFFIALFPDFVSF